MNEQIYILLAQEGGPGGLFDIGATLPLVALQFFCLLYTSPSPRDVEESRMPSSA